MPLKTSTPADLKSQFLQELVEKHAYWAAINDPIAKDHAAAYLKMINVFSSPDAYDHKK